MVADKILSNPDVSCKESHYRNGMTIHLSVAFGAALSRKASAAWSEDVGSHEGTCSRKEMDDAGSAEILKSHAL